MKQKIAKLELQAHTLEQTVTRVARSGTQEKARLDGFIQHQYRWGQVFSTASTVNSHRIDGICNVLERAREPFEFMLNSAQDAQSSRRRRRSPSSNPDHPRAQGRLGGRYAIAPPVVEDEGDADEDDDQYVDIDDEADANPATDNWADASENLQPAEDDETYAIEPSTSGGSRRRRGKKTKKTPVKSRLH